MGVVVTFNPTAWKSAFGQFSYLTDAQAQTYFDLATGICRNDGGGPVCTATIQTALLNMLTAHLAQLFAPSPTGQQPSPTIVGRISSASEGSVSVSTENQYPPGSAQWYQQTQYGSTFWIMSAPYRTAHYIPGPVRISDPFPVYGQYWLGGAMW